nr:alpha-2-macroglobulin family protein [Candidatus Cloacimonadota bacterium]
PADYGLYFVEVKHVTENDNGHSAGQFFWGSYWGNPNIGMQDAGIISLSANQERYNPGEKAEIRLETPANSMMLVSIEKGDQILREYWQKNKGGKTTFEVPITDEMVPNVYCSVSIIQPHDQTDNDRPLRMYGIIPLQVFQASTRQNIKLQAPEVLHPNQKFKCSLQTADHKTTQFTIAVVDEGLLSLTDFASPDAWSEFYQKQMLGVKTFDSYGYVIGANKGDVYKTYSIGGGLAFEKARKKRLNQEDTQRFKPVCLFQGPLFTNNEGFAELEFEMPEYMGAVRIMVVSANGNRYGNAEKTVEVKEDIVLLPTLPRILAPGDKFTIPVEVFATKDQVGKVDVSIQTTGTLHLVDSTVKSITLDTKTSKEITFQAEVPLQVGTAQIVLSAKSADCEVRSTTDIAVRALSARLSHSEMKPCQKGKVITFRVPDDGIPGTNEASVSISRLPKANLTDKLQWLIRYPYGCVEQTTSAVFPQLYLRDFIRSESFSDEWITDNIKQGIHRLQKFQLPGGAFSYWPGDREVNEWGTNYAGHFLLAAKDAGYFVPQEMIDNWLRYQKNEAKKYYYDHQKPDELREQIYRLYLVARAGKAELGAMNYLRENVLNLMNDMERWLLAASYLLAGADDAASEIAMTAGVVVKDYHEMSGSFGSGMRDKAMILDAMVTLDQKEKALSLYLDLSDLLSQKSWYSTQTTSYSLLALGRYIQKYYNNENDKTTISGTITESDGTKQKVLSKDMVATYEIKNSLGKEITFQSANTNELFVTLNWSGVPLKSENNDQSDGIKLKNIWKDADGNQIEPDELKQGDIFSQSITITNFSGIDLENVALVQLLPSGWEIENERLASSVDNNKTKLSQENNRLPAANLKYTDIRDDREMWFFDLRDGREITVQLKLRAVTVGEFFLPATYCEAMYDNRFQARTAGFDVKVGK